jgi:hypothetical protein
MENWRHAKYHTIINVNQGKCYKMNVGHTKFSLINFTPTLIRQNNVFRENVIFHQAKPFMLYIVRTTY